MKELKEDISQIKHSMVKIENDLKYHIKRTDLLESFMKNQIKVLMGVMLATFIALIGNAYAAPIDDILVKIQKEVKCPITVTSGKRSKAHNKAVGGAKNSYHLTDRARDIKAKCLKPAQLGKICKKYANGVIIYKKHVHIDNRDKKYHSKGEY